MIFKCLGPSQHLCFISNGILKRPFLTNCLRNSHFMVLCGWLHSYSLFLKFPFLFWFYPFAIFLPWNHSLEHKHQRIKVLSPEFPPDPPCVEEPLGYSRHSANICWEINERMNSKHSVDDWWIKKYITGMNKVSGAQIITNYLWSIQQKGIITTVLKENFFACLFYWCCIAVVVA